MSYINLKYEPSKNDLITEFYVEPSRDIPFKKVAEQIAAESSIGTWTDVATMKYRIKRLGAKVFEIDKNKVKIAYPIELFEEGNISQILSSIAGNIFGMNIIKNLKLQNIIFPEKIVKSFKGPLFGIHGIRKLLKVYDRPLCGTIIKPKLGLNENEHARVAYEAWTGGIDIVKDDENLSSLSFNRFEKRLRKTFNAKEKAEKETGEKKIYMINITAEVKEMLRRARIVREVGNEYVMVDIITLGWSALQTLRNENDELKLVLHAHRAGHAIFTKGKHGISMLVIAKISRLIGVDQIHTGTANIGKMESGEEETKEINSFLKSEFFGLKSVFPVASGGLHPGSIPKLIELLGKDIIIQAGGGVHGHPNGTFSGAKAMRQAIDAVVNGIPIEDYMKNKKELKLAIKKWGLK
ncbi:MAG: type III ribulose-bisphosphate carboxylase [Candidatus Parvarchaeota archaeon]|nr:type III ribulose-bisphosphate carboxylase [Candidatus Jingweiarchaeum tengchongense]MCW1297829.1 type III ribulose-bisphosphate carboxylase [Candidatus Jingweiarchaeum tengchongense]MCW1299840.1 type III ribulose-bisphosphate carboxylase [Candidatus Jingweiarchaeum tengchongense]MCW1304190.1 type III ribulose-bisphosphate carboxylase [Candidatus Jingweiarchaeum tengchongense]MCW1305218.1 type III ribulose-bisphosphate carboxylase [Candidatus Jingweiarchaeum tengchongense]